MAQLQYHPIAIITTTSGYGGEIRVKPFNRYSIEYLKGKDLQLENVSNNLIDISLERVIGVGEKMRFKFRGIDSHNDAKKLIGKTIYAITEPKDKINLVAADLIGYSVITDKGVIAGTLRDVLWLPSNDVYVVYNGKKEFLIPIVSEIVYSINHNKKVINISSIDGLLD